MIIIRCSAEYSDFYQFNTAWRLLFVP